jgi:hypothetical protein
MPNFSKLAAASAASGFQYYDVQNFSKSIAGQFLPKFTGTLSSYQSTISLVKNRSGIALTSQILTSTLVNFDNDLSAGQYYNFSSGYLKDFTVGSSGGFPIFYEMEVSVSADSTHWDMIVTISNPSAVNDVTPPTIVVSGTVFFYLAPF